MSAAMSHAQTANLKPVSMMDVHIEGGSFWGERLRINREKTLPHNLKMCEETGSHWPFGSYFSGSNVAVQNKIVPMDSGFPTQFLPENGSQIPNIPG